MFSFMDKEQHSIEGKKIWKEGGMNKWITCEML